MLPTTAPTPYLGSEILSRVRPVQFRAQHLSAALLILTLLRLQVGYKRHLTIVLLRLRVVVQRSRIISERTSPMISSSMELLISEQVLPIFHTTQHFISSLSKVQDFRAVR